jgi:hypothetical protein
MTRILTALRSPGAMMIALMLALFPQGEHTAQVFLHFSHDGSNSAQLFSYAFAAAVEVAVLLFVLAGHRLISYGFAAASFLTNIVYYAIGGVALLSVAALPVILLSALLPACIVGYSHTIAGAPNGGTATPAQAPRRYRWQFWRKPTETPATHTRPIIAPAHVVAPHSVTTGHSDAMVGTTLTGQTDVLDTTPAAPDKRTQAMQLRSEGYTAAEIAKMTDTKYSTVRSWMRRATVQTNGVQQ